MADSFIDLTHELKEGILSFPGHQKFNVTKHAVEDPEWLAWNDICMNEHSGTHLDAPYHFNRTKWHVHEIPLDHLVGPAVVINITSRAAEHQGAALLTEDIMDWERAHGQIPDGSIVFILSGWDKYWQTHDQYLGNTAENTFPTNHPGISPEAAKWLVERRKIVGVGVDTASVDAGSANGSPTHHIFAEANIYCIENVVNLGLLPPEGATVHAFPLNIYDGTGSPARVVASITSLSTES